MVAALTLDFASVRRLPGVGTDRMFVVKGVGQADGTLLVTPSAEILKQLAGKTFVAAVLGE